MTFLPVVARELRVAARRRSTYLNRIGAACVPIVMAGFWLPVLASQFSVQEGRALFGALSTLAFGYSLIAGVRATSDCLSVEKREGTIGLLFLTDLKGYDVILGKLVSRSLGAFYALLGTVPVMALALLLGGVTLDEVGRMALLLVNTLFFSMSAGVLASTLSRNDRKAAFATVCIILLASAVPFALGWFYAFSRWITSGSGGKSFMDVADLLRPSPIFAYEILRSNVRVPGMFRDFYQSILLTHALAWIFLGTASVIVPRVCRERPPQKLGLRWLTFRNRWSYGSPRKRARFRRRLLDRNAFYWLAARDRIKAQYVWIFVASLGLIWCWSGWILQSFIFDWDVSLVLLFLLFVFLKVWLTSEVCSRLAEDRASGAFELLLSSPLDPKEMARGESLALWRQFGRPTLAVLGLSWLLLQSALRSPHYGVADGEVRILFWSMMLMLVADLVTLKWVGMWMGLTRSEANKAMAGACIRVLLLPTLLTLGFHALIGLYYYAVQLGQGGENSWTRASACLTWLTIGLGTDLLMGGYARWRFLHQLREVIAQRYVSPAGLQPILSVLDATRLRIWTRTGPKKKARRAWAVWRRWAVVIPVLLVVVGLVVAGFAALAFWKSWSHQRLERRLATIQASGAPVTLASLQVWGYRAGPGENAAPLLQRAAMRLMTFRNASSGLPPGVKLDWPGPVAPVSPELKAVLSRMVQTNLPTLVLIHEAARLRQSHFSMNWQNVPPSVVPWQTFGPLHGAIQLLEYEALLALEAGDIPGVFESIDALLGLAGAMAQEPYIAGVEYRRMFLLGATRVVERLLNQQCVEGAAVERLTARFQLAEQLTGPSFERAVVGQRCLSIEDARSHSQPMTWMGAPTLTGVQKAWYDAANYAADISGLKDRHLTDLLESMDEVIRRSRALGSPAVDASFARILHPREPEFMPGGYWDEMLKEQQELIARLRVAQIALAIERFRGDHQQRPPESLAELTPGLLQNLPADPFTDGPLQYRSSARGYVIYSVGRDGIDDGGIPPRSGYSPVTKSGYDLPLRVER